jgi:hypothetical protein
MAFLAIRYINIYIPGYSKDQCLDVHYFNAPVDEISTKCRYDYYNHGVYSNGVRTRFFSKISNNLTKEQLNDLLKTKYSELPLIKKIINI